MHNPFNVVLHSYMFNYYSNYYYCIHYLNTPILEYSLFLLVNPPITMILSDTPTTAGPLLAAGVFPNCFHSPVDGMKMHISEARLCCFIPPMVNKNVSYWTTGEPHHGVLGADRQFKW